MRDKTILSSVNLLNAISLSATPLCAAPLNAIPLRCISMTNQELMKQGT